MVDNERRSSDRDTRQRDSEPEQRRAGEGETKTLRQEGDSIAFEDEERPTRTEGTLAAKDRPAEDEERRD